MYSTRVILASGSPRRRELLTEMGFDVSVEKIEVDESYPGSIRVTEIAEYLANKKMEAFFKKSEKIDEIVITADTIVVKGGIVLGKPVNLNQAYEYLMDLSNSKHEVITGVCIRKGNYKKCFSEISEVYFDELEAAEIKYYLNNFSVLDKAGSYAIQEWIGLAKISKIIGSYTNIVGLPTQKVYKNLKKIIEKIN